MRKDITLQLEVFGPEAGESHTEEVQWNPDMPLPQHIQVKRFIESPVKNYYDWPPSAQQDPRLDWDAHVLNGKIIYYRADHLFETVYLIKASAPPIHEWSA